MGDVGVGAALGQRDDDVAQRPGRPERLAGLGGRRLEPEADHLDAEDRRHVARQHPQEAGEVGRVEQGEAGAVHLVGARDVLVGRRQHLAVGVLEPVEPLLQPLDEHAAQVDDVAPRGAAVGREQRAHQLAGPRGSAPDRAGCGRAARGSQRLLGHAASLSVIFWPVEAQSLRNAARPLSVSGCSASFCSTDAGGAVMTSAPIRAAPSRG